MKILIYTHSQKDREAYRLYVSSALGKANFDKFKSVQMSQVLGPLPNIVFDAIVAPGNSFGIMTGGFDKALVDAFGERVEHEVKRVIAHHHCGELNVGAAVAVRIPAEAAGWYLIYAPTMRMPKALPKDSDIPYMSARAAIQQMKFLTGGDDDFTILFPLMGVGTGKLDPTMVINQIHMAAGMSITGRPDDQVIRRLSVAADLDVKIRRRV